MLELPPYLSAKDVARLLKVTSQTVWRLASSGHLPSPIRIGPKLARWDQRELIAHLTRRNVTSDADALHQ